MANAGSKGMYEHIDDPMVSVIADAAAAGVTWVAESTNGATDFARAVAAGKGLHYAAASDTTDNDMQEFCSNLLIFTGQEGQSYIEILMQLDSVDDVAFNFGLVDTVEYVASGTGTSLPVELDGTTWTSNAATFIGIVYDVDADNDELHCFWVDDDVDTVTPIASLRMNGMAPTADKWLYMRIDMQDRGSGNGVKATFLAVDHNGKSVQKEFNTTVDRDCPLCYHFSFENRANAAATNCYIKHCNYGQSTADM
jgi:hypothetical protein